MSQNVQFARVCNALLLQICPGRPCTCAGRSSRQLGATTTAKRGGRPARRRFRRRAHLKIFIRQRRQRRCSNSGRALCGRPLCRPPARHRQATSAPPHRGKNNNLSICRLVSITSETRVNYASIECKEYFRQNNVILHFTTRLNKREFFIRMFYTTFLLLKLRRTAFVVFDDDDDDDDDRL